MGSNYKNDKGRTGTIGWCYYVINCGKGMRDWICQPAHQNANVSKCIEDDDPLKRPPYLTDGQLGKNNQYG